jgi:hypothetical protein
MDADGRDEANQSLELNAPFTDRLALPGSRRLSENPLIFRLCDVSRLVSRLGSRFNTTPEETTAFRGHDRCTVAPRLAPALNRVSLARGP